jgi:Raf kinase inhibitor-like YbhB/YbcL family protein
MEITSKAFLSGEIIPPKYTCDGSDVSPPLEWSFAPQDTKCFAIVCDDPDAPIGNWVHWVIFNIPGESTYLPESVPPEESLPDGSRQGINDFGNIGYGGPCPPGGTHRYYFTLYALNTLLNLEPTASKQELINVMNGHTLAQCQLMGRYRR